MSEEQYVIFRLVGEEYGINIMNVTEISPYQEIVKIPNVPDFIEGVINYRGQVIPIICLGKRFGLDKQETDKNTRIIVINLKDKQIGFVVDEASQTMKIDETQIDPASTISASVHMKYIYGIGKVDNRLVVLIDLERVLTDEEMDEIEEIEG